MSERIEAYMADLETAKQFRRDCRRQAYRLVVSFLDTPLPPLVNLPFLGDRGVEVLSAAFADASVGRLRDLGPQMVEHFPIREELHKLWGSLSNEQIRDVVEGVLSTEFRILINLGISLGALVGVFGMVPIVILNCAGLAPETVHSTWGVPVAVACWWSGLLIVYMIVKASIMR